MATRYVVRKTVRLDAGGEDSMVLIYGDAVETVAAPTGGAVRVDYRGRVGTVPEAALGAEPVLECYFLDVGQGDSTLIVTPGGKKILIDGGKGVAAGQTGEAEQALIWKYRLDEAATPVDIDLVVLTHADEDHIAGLVNLVLNPKINVLRVVHSGIATYAADDVDDQLGERTTVDGTTYLATTHDSLEDLDGANLSKQFAAWVAALKFDGVEYGAVRAGDSIDVGDAAIDIEVLGPRREHASATLPDALRWYGDKAHTINGHSVVLRLTYGDVKLLLSGDLNVEGSTELLGDPTLEGSFDSHILKAPHHGSHEFTLDFLRAVNPQITSISSGEIPDHGHPRANFLAAAGRFSRGEEPLLYSTALSAVFGAASEQREHQAEVDRQVRADLAASQGATRELFRKLLGGIINVRTDGHDIYTATRVQTSYWWVTFGPMKPADRTQP